MSSQNDSGFKSFQASGAIKAYLNVDVQSDGTIKACADNTKGVGVLQEDAADGNYASVKLRSAPGTFMTQVSGTAITPGLTYQTITGGYVGVSTGTATFEALVAGVASNGIVLEFAKL